MFEIRFHGRGGQGTVLAAKILADIVLRQGDKQCLAIPEFGVERRGAPVMAYARVSDKPILARTRIYEPDALVILDPTLYASGILKGLKPGGTVLTNSAPEDIALPAVFMASRASDFMTGQVIYVDGGWLSTF